jgi:hypothetical protein
MIKSLLLIVLGLTLWWSINSGPLRPPEDALRDFYEAKNRAEGQLKDTLILNGRRVLPLVLNDLPNKDMPRRRYAISYLGDGGYVEALPALLKIIQDEAEFNYFRADTLEAILQIDQPQSIKLAEQYRGEPDLLGRVATQIVNGISPIYSERSYWEAMTGVHH